MIVVVVVCRLYMSVLSLLMLLFCLCPRGVLFCVDCCFDVVLVLCVCVLRVCARLFLCLLSFVSRLVLLVVLVWFVCSCFVLFVTSLFP